MVDKETAILQLKVWVEQGVLTKDDLSNIAAGGAAPGSPAARSNAGDELDSVFHRLSLPEVLYAVGGLIVFLGIAVLIRQNWSFFSSFTKVAVTLGSALAAYIVGVLFNKNGGMDKIGQVFFALSAMLMPLGLHVALDLSGVDIGTSSAQTAISAILLVFYGASFYLFRRPLLAFFTIIFSSWFYFAVTQYFLVEWGSAVNLDWRIYAYRVLILGIAYLAFGYAFNKGTLSLLTRYLYSIGTLAFLGAAFALGGWQPSQSMFWEILFPGLVFGFVFLSIYLKSRGMLVLGVLYLMAYIIKISGEYFADSIGWPLALVITGLGLIAVGYSAFRIRNKYIS